MRGVLVRGVRVGCWSVKSRTADVVRRRRDGRSCWTSAIGVLIEELECIILKIFFYIILVGVLLLQMPGVRPMARSRSAFRPPVLDLRYVGARSPGGQGRCG